MASSDLNMQPFLDDHLGKAKLGENHVWYGVTRAGSSLCVGPGLVVGLMSVTKYALALVQPLHSLRQFKNVSESMTMRVFLKVLTATLDGIDSREPTVAHAMSVESDLSWTRVPDVASPTKSH